MTLPLLALLLAGPHRPVPGIPTGPLNEIVAGEVLVKFRASTAADLLATGRAKSVRAASKGSPVPGGEIVSQIGHSGWTLWRIPAATDVEAFAKALAGQPGVLAAQPVHRVYPLVADPNDADWNAEETSEDLILYFGDDEPTTFRRLWHMTDTNAFAGWNVWPNRYYTAATKPHDAPLVAVIDTGCDMDHPDFANAGGTSTDSAQGGQLDKSLSRRFELGEETAGSTDDDNGHGTHVAGLALAAANNGAFDGHGVVGTGYACRGMILRVFDDQGTGTDADAAAAMYYAADHGAAVINLSLGTTNYSQLFQDASTYAVQKGSLVVAAGNENGSGGGDLGPIYPAACSGVLAVTANGPDGVPATGTYSGYGPYIDIAAPGGDLLQTSDQLTIQFVFSTAVRGVSALSENPSLYPPYTPEYTYLAGTSMATPQVAGAAGLFYGKNGLDQTSGWANRRVYRALEQSAAKGATAQNNGSWEYYQGYGCLDMETLLLDYNARGATVGAIKGIVYYNGTAFQNVSVRAKKTNNTGVNYSTTTRADGTFRFESLPPGSYTVTTAPFGAVKSKTGTVLAGSDQGGFEMWCGTYTGDDTPPVVARFNVGFYTSTGFSVNHWAYDTETGVDRMTFRIGTSPGATDVMPETEVFPESPVVTRTGLSIPKFNTLQARYTSGAGATATATRAVIPIVADAYVRNGTYATTNYGTATSLRVGSVDNDVSRAFFKIDTSAVPGNVSKVFLRLEVSLGSGRGAGVPFQLYSTSTNWDEASIAWNNAPSAQGVSSTAGGALTSSSGVYNFDITNIVRANRAAGRSIVSLVAFPSRATAGIASRESTAPPQATLTASG